mgnify:CR=1 FL=1
MDLVLENLEKIEMWQHLKIDTYASVIGGLSGLNYLLHLTPTKIILFDVNHEMLRYLDLILEIIHISGTPKEFISRIFSRSVDHFLTNTKETDLNLNNQNKYLAQPVEDDLLLDTLSKLSQYAQITFKETLAKFLSGKTIGGVRNCRRLLPCWPINSRVPVGGGQSEGYNESGVLEPNTNTFFYGNGWLSSVTAYNHVRKILSSTAIQLMELNLLNLNLESIFDLTKNNILHLSNIDDWFPNDWKKTLTLWNNQISLAAGRVLTISSHNGVSIFQADPHLKAYAAIRPHVFGKIVEVTHKTPWGFHEFDRVNVTAEQYLSYEYPADTTILHILIGEGIPTSIFKSVYKKALDISNRVIILEHNKLSKDWNLQDHHHFVNAAELGKILQVDPLETACIKLNIHDIAGLIDDSRNILFVVTNQNDKDRKYPLKVLIIYDVEGWAWWHRAKQIKSGVSAGIRVDIARMDQPFSHELYDYVVIFDPYLQGKIRHVPSDKIIVGCSCPKYIDMAVEAIQSGKCVAGLVNSQAMFDQTGMHDKFFCCQNGVDNDLFHPSSQPVTELIGCWVGNSGSAGNKGLDIIQEACERTGTEILILDKEANRDQATLYTQEEVRNKFYHKASFYLCASEFEGTPNPALEAMACGLPVISTAVGNMPELIKDGWNGYIVERSVDSFVAAIKKLRESNLATMRENARTSIENGWTWVQQAKKYENMFRELKKKEISIPKQQERSSINPSLVDTKTTHASPSESRPERACTNKSNRRHVHSDTIATCNHFPTNAHFLMNDKCNAKCVFCGGDYFRSKSNKHISLDQFKTMARNLRLEHFRSVCLAGAGDPLLSPELLPIIRYIETQYPNLHISITTNGIALSSNLSREFANSRISSINISINAATRETYCRLMQVDRFDRVVANARDFIEQRRLHGNGKFPILQLSCALSRINIEELPQLVQLAKSLGIGHINTMYCRFYPEVIRDLNIESPELRLANEDSLFFHQELSDRMVSEAIKLATRYGIQVGHEPLFSGEMKQRPCHWPTNELMVGFDGEIYPCGGGEVHFKRKVDNGVYHFGNALTETIEQFWNNPDYRSLRHSCLHGEDGEIPECLECANYMRNDVRAHIMKWHDFDRATGSGQEQTDAPLVSVIVPTYNRPAMLTEAISSIFSQTMQSFEIIVVNDAGTDVASVLEKFTDTGKIRFLLHENNRGLAAARNTGIRAARGKYIAYLDDDDTYYPNHLETLVNFLESNDCRVAYTDAVRAVQQNTGDGYHTVEKKVLYSRDFDYDAILVDNFIPVLCVIHEKECLCMSGMFDESLPRHEDWDLWIRMSRHERFAHLPTVTCEYTYRPDGTGMTSSTLPLFLKTYKAVYRKYEDLVAEKPCVQANRQKSLFNATFRTFQYIGERVELFLSNSSVTSEMLAEITPCGAGFSQIKSCLTWRKTDSMPNAAAISCLEMALAIDSENHPARIALCERYLKTGRHADALRHMEFLADANPNEPEFTKTRDALKRQIEACATHTGFREPTTYSMQTCDTPARPVTVSVFSLDAPQEACARIRLLSHFDALNGTIKANWGVISDGVKCTTNLDMIDQADIIVIQRFYPRKGTVPYIEKMLSSGKPVIYEVDDLLLDLPADNHLKSSAGETVDLFPWLLPRVTAITVSTPLLAKEFSVFNPSVHVIPNLADTELFQPVVTKKNGPVIIGFSGTVTHARDLKKIGEALFRVADRYGDKVAFSFMGLSASEFSSLPGFRFLDFERDYASYGKALSSSGIDIALVPLQDNRFNRCKSNIKWLEYSACGIAGVYADLPPYNTSIRHGVSGVLVDDDPDKWFQAICLLIDHPELRKRIANQAKTEVLSHHSLKSGSQVLYTLYESMVGENICTKIA